MILSGARLFDGVKFHDGLGVAIGEGRVQDIGPARGAIWAGASFVRGLWTCR